MKRKKPLMTIMETKFVAEKNNEPNLTLITFPIVDNKPLYDISIIKGFVNFRSLFLFPVIFR